MSELLIAAFIGAAVAVVIAAARIARGAAAREARAAAMEAVARRYALGDLSRPSPDYGDDDLGRVARSMDAAVHELGRRVNDLTRDRARMQAILASMVEGVLVVDGQGRLQLVNEAARRLLKLDREATGRPYLEALRHPGIAEQIGRTLGGHDAESLELNLALDRSRTLVAHVAPVVAEGRGAVLVLHDITDLKSADQIRRDFVANVSHELRTPLTAIKGYAEALLDDPEDEEARERFLDIIHRHATRMERLVKDLLRLARLDAGQEAVELAPCDVQAIAGGVVADLDPLVQEKRQHVQVGVPADARMLVADPAKLHDILRNLDRERGELHARRRRDRADHSSFGRTVRDHGERHRSGPAGTGSPAGVRALLPCGQVAGAARRHRARPRDRQASRAGDGRNGRWPPTCPRAVRCSRCDYR